jgi:hypothetical protein
MWSKLRINFWASTNSQIELGFLHAGNMVVKNNAVYANATISKSFKNNDRPVIRAFINGYESQSEKVQIAVSPSNLQENKLTVKINIGPSSVIKKIWISYIAFSPVTATFNAYGGQFSKYNFKGTVKDDVSNTLYRSPYVLYGLVHISINGKKAL